MLARDLIVLTEEDARGLLGLIERTRSMGEKGYRTAGHAGVGAHQRLKDSVRALDDERGHIYHTRDVD